MNIRGRKPTNAFKAQACYLRTGDDALEDAVFFRSVKDATADYRDTARELDRYGQSIGATLHFVDGPDEEPAEYPDRVLSLTERGAVKSERA